MKVDDDNGDDKLFLWNGWPTKGVLPFRDPHRRESPTRRKEDLNLRRTLRQVLMNEVVQQ